MENEKCKHEKRLSVYGRDENNWISSLKIRGEMVYICEDCGEVFGEKVVEEEIVKSNDTRQRNGRKTDSGGASPEHKSLGPAPAGFKSSDANCEGEDNGK